MTQGKEVAERQRAIVIRDYLQSDKVKEQIEYAIPQYLNADRFLRIAYTAITKNPTLLECTTESLLSAIIQAATLGLELVLGRAHLVPFKNRQKNVTEVVFIPGYQGLADLMRRSGEVADLWGEVVYAADTFKIMYGLDRSLEHEPKFIDDRGDPIGAYFVVLHRDGTKGWTYMPISEVYKKHRDRSQAYKFAEKSGKKDSPWHEFEEDMVKKTVLKKHSKLAPMSVDVSAAVAFDDATEAGAPVKRRRLMLRQPNCQSQRLKKKPAKKQEKSR
jgi:recombination protein RecT